ncbi:C40 family peptidase [Streptomyces sp. NBRC 109706]|uniref:C40 family peptidase n=1 Tax=Streptomyces sp. NBRC 109706 TaxID=1550035 RepID=UPI000785BB35|nr:C40 family peptidase [Streptomyces sp. NBRC 109706]
MTRLTAFSAAATAAALLSTAPVLASPGREGESADAARQVDRLFAEADRAVDAYNGAAERVAALEAEVALRQEQMERRQQQVNELRGAIGSAAAAHYRAGGLDASLALLLSDSPDDYLARSASYERMSARRGGELAELLAAQRGLAQRQDEADQRLELLAEERAELERHKEAAQNRLAEARELLRELTEREEREERERRAADEKREQDEEKRAARAAERDGTTDAPSPEPPSPLGADAVAPSGRGGTALAAAQTVLGRPYGWGQAGPDAFDCSGLVQWAYARAGVSLPRTSQAQAGAGRRVPLDQAQPGDIVVYRADASHVGLYAGGGQVLHAPSTGSTIRYDPVGMMPVSSVVRP